ncbi:MAG: hypothetical protein AAGB04_04060 [Pseudomonadota bacterium]
MTGLTTLYSIAPRALALVAFSAAIIVGSLLSKPELLMRTALTAPLPSGQIHLDEIVDQNDLPVLKLLAEANVRHDLASPNFLPAGHYGQVSPGDRVPVSLSSDKFGLMDVTDVRELGKLIIPGTGQSAAKDYLLLTGRIIGNSDGQLVRLVVDANARPPFGSYRSDDRRSL